MRNIILSTLIVLTGVLFGTPVLALTVSPAKAELTGDPGTTVHGEIELFSEQEGTRTFFSSFENFEPTGDSGAPHFIGAEDGLATWMETSPEVTIESGQHLLIPFSITIPADAEPGGYFAAIFFGDQPPGEEGGQVSVGGKIGVLMLLRVSGEVEEAGGIVSFGTKDNIKLYTTLPVGFEYRINNDGGDRIVPHGDLFIKNTLRMTSEILPANKTDGSVLPNSARKFELQWGESENKGEDVAAPSFFDMVSKEWNDFHFGWYRADLKLTWGDSNQVQQSSVRFFIVPWQLLIVVGSVLLLVGILGILILRRYNRWIIAAAMRQQQVVAPQPLPPPAPPKRAKRTSKKK